MNPDPRWLEILKSSGGQSFAAAGAFGALIVAEKWKWIPELPSWAIQVSTFLFVLFGLLAVVSFLSAVNNFFGPRRLFFHYLGLHREKKEIERYIPYMTEEERQIIGYLLKYKMKTITANVDGGNAVTLISRGIIVRQMRPGQQASMDDIPMGVPEHVWKILEKHKDQFPHRPMMDGRTEVYPWRQRLW